MKMMNKTSLAFAIVTTLGVISPTTQAVVKLTAADTDTVANGGPVLFAREEQNEGSALIFKSVASKAVGAAKFSSGDLTVWLPVVGSYPITGTDDMTLKIMLTPGVLFATTPYLVCPNSGDGVAATTPDINSVGFSVYTDAYNAAADARVLNGTKLTTTDTIKKILDTPKSVSGVLLAPTKGGSGYESAVFYFDPLKMNGFSTRLGSGCLLTYSGTIYDGTPNATANLSGMGAIDAAVAVTGAIGVFSVANPQGISSVTLTREVTYKQAGAAVTNTAVGTIIKFVTGVTAVVTKTNIAGDKTPSVTIDVQSLSKEFVKDVLTESTKKVLVGGIKLVPAAADSLRLSDMSAGEWTASTLLDTVTAEITGNPVAGASQLSFYKKEGTPNCTTRVVGVAPSSDSGTGTDGTTTTTSGGSKAVLTVTNTNIAGATEPQIDGNGFEVCIEVGGTTFLSEGPLNLKLTGTGKANGTRKGVFDFGDVGSVGSPLTTVGKNGATVRVLNIPYYGGSTLDRPFIRMYNTSDKEITVLGTLYGQDGKLITGAKEGATIATIPPKGVKVLDSDALATVVGGGTKVSAWSGRAWLLLQTAVDKSLFKVQSLVRSPNGSLINLSADASD